MPSTSEPSTDLDGACRLATASPDGATLAVERRAGRRDRPGVLFCGGFHSSMHGIKARAVDAACARRELACTRFDYRGHGDSDGAAATATLVDWLDDALAVVDALPTGERLVVIGSSMGAWLAVHVAYRRPERVAALLLVAAAPDFLQRCLPGALGAAERARFEHGEVARLATPEDRSGYPVTRALLESGRTLALLDGETAGAVRCPVRMLHGSGDEVAPWPLAAELLERLGSDDATLELVRGADHRLSSPRDLERLERTLAALADIPSVAAGAAASGLNR